MAILLLKKSYQHKDLKEIKFHDLWNSYGVFTTMRAVGRPVKILFFKEHIENLLKSLKIYKKFKARKKIIGICLGYQQILFCEKAKIVQQKNIYHGYQSRVKITSESKLFKKNQIFKVGRYHSLKLLEPFKSNNIKISMRCAKTNIPMGIEDLKNNIYGFQFHPESFLTENGNFIIKKILSA